MADEKGRSVNLLLVEDNEGDVRLVEEALAELSVDCSLCVVQDGREALDYLYQRGDYESASRPDLVLLDLSLPKRDGLEVLEELSTTSTLQWLPVIVLSGSDAQNGVLQSYELGANAYFNKPVNPDDFLSLIKSIVEMWATFGRFPHEE